MYFSMDLGMPCIQSTNFVLIFGYFGHLYFLIKGQLFVKSNTKTTDPESQFLYTLVDEGVTIAKDGEDCATYEQLRNLV